MSISQRFERLIGASHHAQSAFHKFFVQIDGTIFPMIIVKLHVGDSSGITDTHCLAFVYRTQGIAEDHRF